MILKLLKKAKYWMIAIHLLSFSLFAQNKETDSLKRCLKSLPGDTIKVKVLNKIFTKELYAGQYDSALKYAQAAKSLAEKIDFKRGVASSLNHIGMYNEFKGAYAEAIKYYKQSLDLYTKIDFKKGIAIGNNNIGLIYYNQGDYSKALECFLNALKIREETHDEFGICTSYNNIGEVYHLMENFAEALQYYFKSLKIAEKLNEPMQIATCYNNIGNIYSKNNLTLAESYYLKSLKTRTELEDRQGMAGSYNNLGSVLQSQKKYKEALEYFQKGVNMLDEMGEKSSLPTLLNNVADVYIKLREFKKAAPFLNRALTIALQNGNKDDIKICYGELSKVEEVNGNTAKAFEYYKLYVNYRDSMLNEENTKNIVRAEMNFEFGKKEAAAKLEQEKRQVITNAENKKQQIILWSVSGILLLVIGFALFVYRSNLQKHKANVEILVQKNIIEEKQKEIIDSITYAKHIQTAIMATEEDIKLHFPESFLFYKPKDIIAGDFYFFEENVDYFFIAVADCTGHGVPGALVSVVCSNALTRSVKEFGLSEPGAILDKTRELVVETFKKSGQDVKDGMDISFCSIQKTTKNESKIIKWAGANNPLWITQNNELKEIRADKQPIGQSEIASTFSTHALPLHKGDMLFLFTDGFADQFGGPKGKKFKHKQLQNILLSTSNSPVELQKQKLLSAFEEWKGKLEQVDDVCIIGIRV
jgi:tetratricopeptide (TPR) repeat protein/serine phosphatase RsbU (regulator of sigma subunit)